MTCSRVAAVFGPKMPRRKPSPISGTVAYKCTARYGGGKIEWKLWKARYRTHNRLVVGSNPTGPTSKRPPDGFFCQEILFIREADNSEGNRSLPFNLDALDPQAAHQLVDLLRDHTLPENRPTRHRCCHPEKYIYHFGCHRLLCEFRACCRSDHSREWRGLAYLAEVFPSLQIQMSGPEMMCRLSVPSKLM